jgi:hypothetical protein
MKVLQFFAIILSCSFLMSSSCGKPYIADPDYATCCPDQVHSFTGYDDNNRAFYVYVPSAFTPDNHDGVNDYFYPQQIDSLIPFDTFSQQLHYWMRIEDTLQNVLATILFNDLTVPISQRAWDGKVPGTNGRYHKGPFNYTIRAGDYGLRGRGCSILCGEGTKHLLDNPHCLFPLHGNNNGTYTPRDPRTFENLNCIK